MDLADGQLAFLEPLAERGRLRIVGIGLHLFDPLQGGRDRLRVLRVALGIEQLLDLRAVGVITFPRFLRLAPMANRAALRLHGLVEDLHRVVARLRFHIDGLELLEKRLYGTRGPDSKTPATTAQKTRVATPYLMTCSLSINSDSQYPSILRGKSLHVNRREPLGMPCVPIHESPPLTPPIQSAIRHPLT